MTLRAHMLTALLLAAPTGFARQATPVPADPPSPAAQTSAPLAPTPTGPVHGVEATVSLAAPTITIAQLAELTIVATRSPGSPAIEWQGVDLAVPPDWRILRVERHDDTTLPDGSIRESRTFIVEPFLEGEHTLGPAKIPLALATEEAPPIIITGTLPLAVTSVLPSESAEPLDPAPSKSIVDPIHPVNWATLGAAVGAGALVLAALAAATVAMRRRAAKEHLTARTPEELAYAALDTLKHGDLFRKGFVKEYFAEGSDILRRYIEDRFALPAPELTTQEFLQRAASSDALTPSDVRELEGFLLLCDMVKFAAHRPGDPEAESLLRIAHAFIARTRAAGIHIIFDAAGRRLRRQVDDPTTPPPARQGAAA